MVRLLLLANVVNGYYKNNEHLVRARPHSQVLVPGSALGYMTQGCSWVLPQVPGDMCLVQELGCQLGVPVRCKKGLGGYG